MKARDGTDSGREEISIGDTVVVVKHHQGRRMEMRGIVRGLGVTKIFIEPIEGPEDGGMLVLPRTAHHRRIMP